MVELRILAIDVEPPLNTPYLSPPPETVIVELDMFNVLITPEELDTPDCAEVLELLSEIVIDTSDSVAVEKLLKIPVWKLSTPERSISTSDNLTDDVPLKKP